ncbi:MAG: hypothetical protein JO344_12185, partial [Planctomycetaceae bacterium]|nr:hypothetical protein [Planctomycetaceae bacterium]
ADQAPGFIELVQDPPEELSTPGRGVQGVDLHRVAQSIQNQMDRELSAPMRSCSPLCL